MSEKLTASLSAMFKYQRSEGITAQEFLQLMPVYGAPILLEDSSPVPVGHWESHLEAHHMCHAVKEGFDPNPLDLAVHVNTHFGYAANDILHGVKNCCEGITDAELDEIADRIGAKHQHKTIALKNKDGHYFGFKADHHKPFWGDANRIGGYERISLIHNSNGTYTFQNKDGNYFGFKAGNDPEIWATANRIGGYEELTMIDNGDGTKAFKNKDGNYLGFKANHSPELWVASRIGGYEKLTIEDL